MDPVRPVLIDGFHLIFSQTVASHTDDGGVLIDAFAPY